MPGPRISVILVSWNSGAYLPRCLDSLAAQSFKDFEVILIDNGSSDGAVNDLQENWPLLHIQVRRLGENKGFAVANNIGARLAQGLWLALLNTDAFPEPRWLEFLIEAAKLFPNAFFASRQILAGHPGYLDGEGDACHVSGPAWRRNYGLQVYPAQVYQEVFGACGAAAMFPRAAFLEAGGFDEDYFAYFEDVDLGYRLRLRGMKCIFVPQAIVHHVGSASVGKKSDFAVYHGFRNMIWTYLKDTPFRMYWIHLPLHIGVVLLFFEVYALRGQAKPAWRGLRDACRGIPVILRKRKDIQRDVKVHWREIYVVMSRGVLESYREFIRRNYGE